jgi:hypothetical protein
VLFISSPVDFKCHPKSLVRKAGEEFYDASGNFVIPVSATNTTALPLCSPPSGFATAQQLPDFPSFRDFDRASSIPSDKLQTLLTMYRAHCQRIMDSVNKFSFTEVRYQETEA